MKLIQEKLEEIISREASILLGVNNFNELVKLISDLKKAGLLKQSGYTLPLVDTIGKTYYCSINKRT